MNQFYISITATATSKNYNIANREVRHKRGMFTSILVLLCTASLINNYINSGTNVTLNQPTHRSLRNPSPPASAAAKIPIVETDATTNATATLYQEMNTTMKEFGTMKLYGTNIERYLVYFGLDELQHLMNEFWKGSFCGIFINRTDHYVTKYELSLFDNIPTTTIHITFSCMELFQKSWYGTGNYMMLFYGIRLAARQIGNIDVSFRCMDADAYSDQLILPWLMGEFPRTVWNTTTYPAQDRMNPSIEDLCRDYSSSSMIHDIQYDLRRMAIGVVGIPFGTNHPSEKWAEEHLWSNSRETRSYNKKMQLHDPTRETIPATPTIEIDDVAIHFRCGDIVDYDDVRFGFMKFTSIIKYISPEARSIGILTQPFDTDAAQQRSIDNSSIKRRRCRKIVHAFRSFLQDQYGTNDGSNNTKTSNTNDIRISIRNDPKETIAVTYARMIMANQTIIGTSSFGAFAGLASFGTSYILNTNYKDGPNEWLLRPNIMSLTNNVVLVDEPILFAKICKEQWGETNNTADGGDKVIQWMQNDYYNLSNNFTVIQS